MLLLTAAANGRIRTVRALVSAGADVNKQRNDGASALSIASQEGHLEIVNILLDNGAQIETRDNLGRTPLWFAAANEQTDIVRALVSAGADVNTQRNDGSSALGFASKKGHLDIVNILLENGAQIETRDNEGHTPLWFAASNGQTDIVRALVSAGADVNTQRNDGSSALGFASVKGHLDIVNVLLENGAQIETTDNFSRTPLWYAAGYGQTDTVRALVSAGADVNTQSNDGTSALFYTSQEGHTDIVNLLLDNCTDTECRDNKCRTAVWFAASTGHIDIVNTLLKHSAGMHVRSNDNMELIDVVSYYGHTDIVQILTNCSSSAMGLRYNKIYPPNVTHVDCHRNTALHLTTDLQTATSLLEKGANVDAENVEGLRPIHCAVKTGLVELVDLLIQHGANVDAADIFGNRPLHDAVCHGLNVVQLLVQHGAKLNVQNIDGKTPLHIAVERQQADIIVFLMTHDADVGLTDVWHNTPLHYLTYRLLAVSELTKNIEKLLKNKPQHLLVRNAVDISVFMHIATHGILHDKSHKVHSQHSAFNRIVNSATLTQVHNVCLSQQKLDIDCQGNTTLHYAVGVFGKLKMFKMSTGIVKTVELLVKCGADINAQNNDGLTPLHVARGEKAIEACLQHGGDQSLTITDNRGRNFWHLLFLTRTNKTELEKSIRPMIATSDAKYSTDDLNRTPLHYACMGRYPFMPSWRWLVTEFIKQFSVEHINKQDRFGRTALHYAAIGNESELRDMLKTMKADNTVQDNYQKISEEYANIQRSFNTKVALLQLTKSTAVIRRNHDEISAIMQTKTTPNSSSLDWFF